MTTDDYRAALIERATAQVRHAAVGPLADAVITLSCPGPAPLWSGDVPGLAHRAVERRVHLGVDPLGADLGAVEERGGHRPAALLLRERDVRLRHRRRLDLPFSSDARRKREPGRRATDPDRLAGQEAAQRVQAEVV